MASDQSQSPTNMTRTTESQSKTTTNHDGGEHVEPHPVDMARHPDLNWDAQDEHHQETLKNS